MVILDGDGGEEARRLEAIVNDHNLRELGSDWRPLVILLRDADGRLIGGLKGSTEWGWLHVEYLAVEEPHRRRGHGSRLLAAAEREALARGCHDAFLDTFSFQALPFYEAHGYRVFGELEGFAGHTKHFLRKRLADAE